MSGRVRGVLRPVPAESERLMLKASLRRHEEVEVTHQTIEKRGRHLATDPGDWLPDRRSPSNRCAVRVRDQRVETAVWTLTHPATGRAVTLVGVMHIGEPAYFGALSDILGELSAGGAQVHVEGIRRHDADDSDVTPWERDRLAESAAWVNPESAGAALDLLRLDGQGACLRLPDGFRNVDLSDLELLRAVGWDDFQRLLGPAPPLPAATAVGFAVRAALRFELQHHRAIDAARSIRPRNRRLDRVVIGRRNQVAFAGASAALQHGDVAMVWGADHLPGLAALFVARGYGLRTERWFEACTL